MRNAFGYILGFLVFVAGIPALMWWVSGRDLTWVPPLPLAIISIVLMFLEGNPFDAYNHELAPRTKHLMTDGPYRFSRNPMLLGVYIYYIGVIIWLLKCWPLVVFAFIVVLLTLQVRSEEKRLEADFGEEYRVYREKVPRYLFRL